MFQMQAIFVSDDVRRITRLDEVSLHSNCAQIVNAKWRIVQDVTSVIVKELDLCWYDFV